MKKILLVMALFLFVFTLTACEDVCIGAECILTEEEVNEDPPCVGDDCEVPDPNDDCEDIVCEECPEPVEIDGTVVQNAIQYKHINGHGDVTDKNAFILLEWPLRDYVRYQIAYLSCTCRNPDVNYWQLAYVEINLYTNDIRVISFNEDSTHHYTAGMWGDSSPTPAGKTLENFEDEFIPWLIGKSLTDLEGISVFKNDEYYGIQNTTNIDEQDLIDGYAGSSVSTNNMIRVMKSLLEYHEEKNN